MHSKAGIAAYEQTIAEAVKLGGKIEFGGKVRVGKLAQVGGIYWSNFSKAPPLPQAGRATSSSHHCQWELLLQATGP